MVTSSTGMIRRRSFGCKSSSLCQSVTGYLLVPKSVTDNRKRKRKRKKEKAETLRLEEEMRK
jgi:hypothetical protein